LRLVPTSDGKLCAAAYEERTSERLNRRSGSRRIGTEDSEAAQKQLISELSPARRLHPGNPSIAKKYAAFRPKVVSLNRVPRAFAGAKQRPQSTPSADYRDWLRWGGESPDEALLPPSLANTGVQAHAPH
jgi:hypothetical protein